MNQLPSDVRRTILNMLVEGMGINATTRTSGVSYHAVNARGERRVAAEWVGAEGVRGGWWGLG